MNVYDEIKSWLEYIKTHKDKTNKAEYLIRILETVLADRENLKEQVEYLKRSCDRKENSKIEEEQENVRLQEEVERLKEERELVGITVKNKRDGKLGIVLHQWESGSVAVLENISPRVINTHDNWDTLEIVTDEVKQIKTKQDYIPKSVIKEKIEEIKNSNENYTFEKLTSEDIRRTVITNLQELLEGDHRNLIIDDLDYLLKYIFGNENISYFTSTEGISINYITKGEE